MKSEQVYLKPNRDEMIIGVEFTTTENVFFLIRFRLYFPFRNSFRFLVPLTYEIRFLINSNKYSDQTSLANEIVVFGQKQIKFLLNEKQPNWSEKVN